MKFPKDFLFGVANADHQVEAYDPKTPDVWDLWEQTQQLTPRGRAADFTTRYPEDLDRAAALGCKIFRFSIAWSRVQPSENEWDEAALDHYRKLAETIQAKGMKVMVTLVHFVWPVWLEKKGGLIADEFPDLFAEYGDRVAAHLGDLVDYWISFNEPTQLVYGFIKPWWQNRYYMPPGIPAGKGAAGDAEAIGKLIPNLFLAHARARVRIKAHHPDTKVGVNPLVTGMPPWLQGILDALGCKEWLMSAMYKFNFSAPLASENAKVDLVIGGLKREDYPNLAYSNPYLITGKSVLVKNKSEAQSLANLASKRIALVDLEDDRALAETHLPADVEFIPFPSYEKARKAILADEVDALYGDAVSLMPPQVNNVNRFRFLIDGLTRQAHSAAVPQGHRGLLDILNAVISELKCEVFGACEIPDHSEPPTDYIPLSLADYFANSKPEKNLYEGEGLGRIKRRGFLKVGLQLDCLDCPDEAKSTTGQSLELKLAKATAKAIFGDESKIEIVPLETGEKVKALKTTVGKANLLWRFLGTAGLIANSNWWYLGSRGKLPEHLCPKEAQGAHDFIGLDYYWGLPTKKLHKFDRLVEAGEGRFLNAPVWPEGLGHALRRYHRWFPDQELMIVENGCVPLANGYTRSAYLKLHLQEVAKACAEGVPVSAYFCWSLTSNREWGHAFTHQTDFGLYHVAMDTDPDLARVPSEEVAFYKEVIKNAAPD